MKRFLAILAATTVIGGIAGIGTTRVMLQDVANTLPEIHPEQLLETSVRDGATSIEDKDGHEIDNFASSRRIPLTYEQIPPVVRDAFIAAEDQHFWTHDGVDPASTLRAAFTDLTTGRHEGGSGIPQQVIKNFITGNDRSMGRKVAEALLAIRLVQIMDRRDILRVYLNGIWLGHGAYGVGAASKAWFQKDVSGITLAEAAFMAGLARGPALMEPESHPDRARARRRYVLSRMVSSGFISQSEADAADKAPLPHPDTIANTGGGGSYYTETVRGQVLASKGVSGVYAGGGRIRTWQDPQIQKSADMALMRGLLTYDRRHGWQGNLKNIPSDWKVGVVSHCSGVQCIVLSGNDSLPAHNGYGRSVRNGMTVAVTPDGEIAERPSADGAVVVMSPQGHVLAETGGFWRGNASFNRATQSARQTGSTIKPFIAMAAIERGWTPDTIVADVPVSIAIPQTTGMWQPGGDGHDDGMGLITLRDALAQSRNQAFVRLGNDLGFDTVYDTFRNFGIYSDTQTLTPASLLGASETSLLKLTTAYASLRGNAGHTVQASFIQGEPDQTSQRPIPDTAPVLSMLSSVITDGTAEQAFAHLPAGMRQTIGGKTGTSNEVMDSWFVGYEGEYVIGVHVGMDSPTPLGNHEFGSTIAAPIAADIMTGIWDAGKVTTSSTPEQSDHPQ